MSQNNRPQFEALEERVLLSATPFEEVSVPAVVAEQTQQEQVEAGTEVIIVDAGVENYEQLLEGINRDAEIIVLDADSDGISQITAALAGRENISALHIISHGNAGTVNLGTSQLDSASLSERSGEVAAWGASLTDDADILIYGCDVGQDSAFVDSFAEVTGADIAASDDVTGAQRLHGDAALEVTNGNIEHDQLLDQSDFNDFDQKLAVTTLNVTNASPTFTRPGSAGSFHYETVALLGNGNILTAEITAANGGDTTDSYFLLYADNFDPANPGDFIARDDDGGNSFLSAFEVSDNLILDNGRNYILVTTTYSAGRVANFDLQYDVNTPAPTFLLETTASIRNTSPVFTRPGRGGNFFYDAVKLVGNGEKLEAEITAANGGNTSDSYFYLYADNFDPANPGDFIARDDDGGNGVFSAFTAGDNITLDNGRNYILVTTTYNANQFADFELKIKKGIQVAQPVQVEKVENDFVPLEYGIEPISRESDPFNGIEQRSEVARQQLAPQSFWFEGRSPLQVGQTLTDSSLNLIPDDFDDNRGTDEQVADIEQPGDHAVERNPWLDDAVLRQHQQFLEESAETGKDKDTDKQTWNFLQPQTEVALQQNLKIDKLPSLEDSVNGEYDVLAELS